MGHSSAERSVVVKKTCIAIRHINFEDLGTFAEPIRTAGYEIRYLDAVSDDLTPAGAADLVVFLGGPIGVYEESAYPFLTSELRIAARRIEGRRATLGICLGAQVIARAGGAQVYRGPHGKEIGWEPVSLTDEGRRGATAPLEGEGGWMFHWHGDTFDLPQGARLLASTVRYPNQAYAVGEEVLAFQFHPEVQRERIEHWLVGHAVEIAHCETGDVATIRSDTQRHGTALMRRGRETISRWLARLR